MKNPGKCYKPCSYHRSNRINANQSTGFYLKEKLFLNELNKEFLGLADLQQLY